MHPVAQFESAFDDVEFFSILGLTLQAVVAALKFPVVKAKKKKCVIL